MIYNEKKLSKIGKKFVPISVEAVKWAIKIVCLKSR